MTALPPLPHATVYPPPEVSVPTSTAAEDDAYEPPSKIAPLRVTQLRREVVRAWAELPGAPERTRDLETLLELLLRRQSTPDEVAIFRSHLEPMSPRGLRLAAIGWSRAEVIDAIVRADDELQIVGARILTTKESKQLLGHARSVRLARWEEVSASWCCFVAGNAVLLALSLTLLAGGIAEMATLNVYAEMPLTIVFCALLAILALLGVAGSARLKAELMEDADGRETTAQRCVEVYFWAMATLCVGVAIVAVSYLVFPNLVDVDATGATEPERLQRLAALLGVGAAAGDGTVESVAAFLGTLNAAFAAGALVVIALIVPLLVAAARIVTYYEIRQGLLVYLTFFYTAAGLAFIYCGAVSLVFKEAQARLVPVALAPDTDAVLNLLFALMIVIGVGMTPVGVLGLLAGAVEDVRLLRRFEVVAAVSVVLLVAVAVFALVASLSELFDFVDPHCKSLINFGHEDWLVEMVPGVGCTKYYGVAISIVDDVIIESTDGVGQIVQCNAKEEIAYAWERTYLDNPWDSPEHAHVCGEYTAYGCLALGACCSALKLSLRKLAQLFAIVSFLAAAALAIGACTARYVRTHYLAQKGFGAVVLRKWSEGSINKVAPAPPAAVVTKRMYGDDGGYGAVGAAPLVKWKKQTYASPPPSPPSQPPALVAGYSDYSGYGGVHPALPPPPPLRTASSYAAVAAAPPLPALPPIPAAGYGPPPLPPELARLSSTTAYSPSGRRASERTVSFSPRSPPPSTPPSYTKAGSAEALYPNLTPGDTVVYAPEDEGYEPNYPLDADGYPPLPAPLPPLPRALSFDPTTPSGITVVPPTYGDPPAAAPEAAYQPPATEQQTYGGRDGEADYGGGPRSLACTRRKS